MPQSFCEGVLERIERELAIPQHDYKRPVDMREFLLVEAFPDLSRWMRHLQKNGREPAFRLGEAISPRAASGPGCRCRAPAGWSRTNLGNEEATSSGRREDFRHRCQLRFRRAPSTMSAFNADALIASPSWKSMARTDLLSRRVLNRPFGSFSWAPFGNVSLTAFLRVSPMQTMPSWDQTGTPSGREGFFHFTSSITPGSAPLMRARSWPSLSPLQPAVFRTMASICWDADASFMPMLCRGGSAPSGLKGSVPCPFDACSQANNTAAAFPPAVRIASARCAGFSFRLSSARAPNKSIHCGQEA